MTSIGTVNQSIPDQGMEECSIDTHVTSSISVTFMHDAYNGLRIKETNRVETCSNYVFPFLKQTRGFISIWNISALLSEEINKL